MWRALGTLSAQAQRSSLNAATSIAPLRWVGKISYGLYLWHWVAIRALVAIPLDPTVMTLLKLSIPFAIATASFYLLEQRFLRLKERWHQKDEVPPAALMLKLNSSYIDVNAATH